MFKCLVIRKRHYLTGIRRCGLVEGNMSLEVGLEVSSALGSRRPVSQSLLAHPNVELSVASPAPCLPVCCHASHRDDNGLNL